MLKTKTKITICLAGMISLISAILSCLFMPSISATECDTSPCNANTIFQVDVKESLSVSVTTPSSYKSGSVGSLLTEQITVSVTSNNSAGFVAGIRASNADATLVGDNGGTLSNLSSSTAAASFPTGSWGYSLNTSTYNPLPAYNGTPEVLFSNETAGTTSAPVNFAAKAGYGNNAGTYTGTVNISVVSGRTSFDPDTPVPDPVGPDSPSSTPTYHSTQNVTTYTTKAEDSSTSTSTETTQVSSDNNTSQYPLGETQTSTAKNGTSLPVILAVTSAVSAAAGLGFFIIAKRREEEEEEDE